MSASSYDNWKAWMIVFVVSVVIGIIFVITLSTSREK